ncbi:MAG TPA: response regulator transcription factor [Clostridiaceae bacterium]|nr:response regulator transcription factor [Clostridiaceae bacterium]
MNEKQTVLICDDDQDILAALKIYLSAEGYKVLEANNGAQVLNILAEEEVHLIVLDIMMPVLDGIDTTKKIRETSNIPIILLTAKSEDHDKVFGLNIGADDYIVKPFNPMEVVARIRSQLRRYTNLGGIRQSCNRLVSGPLVMETDSREVTVDGKSVALTPIEYNILKLLLEQAGKVFSTTEIYEEVWQSPAFGADGTVAVHIRHLREKIEADPANPQLITVIWGQGYRLEPLPPI